VQEWDAIIERGPVKFGTHSLRRTKVVLIHRRTGNFRSVQLLLRHSKIGRTLRCLGIEVDDAIEVAEKFDICEGLSATAHVPEASACLGRHPKPFTLADNGEISG